MDFGPRQVDMVGEHCRWESNVEGVPAVQCVQQLQEALL